MNKVEVKHVFVVSDWFHDNEAEDAFPVAVVTSLEVAKQKAQQRAKEAKQEFINGNYSEERLSIQEIDDDNFGPAFSLGIFYEPDGLVEQVSVFEMPVNFGVAITDLTNSGK